MLVYIEKNQLLWLYTTNKKILMLYMNMERELVYKISFHISVIVIYNKLLMNFDTILKTHTNNLKINYSTVKKVKLSYLRGKKG